MASPAEAQQEVELSNYCTVCMCEIEEQAVTTLKCLHRLHTDCYTTFLAHNVIHKKPLIECPVCRDKILRIHVETPTDIHIITYNADTGDVDDADVENQTLLNNYSEAPTTIRQHTIANTVVKMGIIAILAYVSYLTIQCGSGTNNILCPSY